LPDKFSLVHSMAEIDAESWNTLAGTQPFMQHAFLDALEKSQCVNAASGWIAHHIVLLRDGALCAAMPLYLKSHSRGEYIFDHAWADAYYRHGLAYYPKLLCAVPFTPVPGIRLLARTHEDKVVLARQVAHLAKTNGLSSVHILLPDENDRLALEEAGYMIRENVQFHWMNKGYTSFESFLLSMSQQKRKKLRQDRQKVQKQGISFAWLHGPSITEDSLGFFYECYVQTYLQHGNAPYLNLDFFQRMHAGMGENMLLVLAMQAGKPIAAALDIIGSRRLYGRYWGSMQYIAGLHFETCYMQGIEFCIANGLDVFEGGAQGEHKLARGMLPVTTYSAHWIGDQRFAHAIADFLEKETPAVQDYIEELHAHSPFKTAV
jgi:predicted N-acyltransferase